MLFRRPQACAQVREVLLSKAGACFLSAVLGFCSRLFQLPLRACTFLGISFLSLSFMLHLKCLFLL